MSNEDLGYPAGYALHILFIKLWEWEAVKENANMQIMRHGPEQTMCEAFETAGIRITDLKEAIKTLKTPTP
jgi:hypothetical protein